MLATDERKDRNKRLAGVWRRYSDPLPDRLAHLASWFGRVAQQPAAYQSDLHCREITWRNGALIDFDVRKIAHRLVSGKIGNQLLVVSFTSFDRTQ